MLKIETKGLSQKMSYISRLGNFFKSSEMPRIVRNETIRVLMSMVKSEKKGKKSTFKIEGKRDGFNKGTYSNDEKLSINSGRRGGSKHLAWVRVQTKEGNKFIPLGRWDGDKTITNIGKVDDALIARLIAEGLAEAKAQEKIHLASRGSTAKSWLDLAEKISQTGDLQPVVDPAIARARKKSGRPFVSSVSTLRTKTYYSITGLITSAILGRNGGQSRVDFAFKKRELFFARAIKRGWLRDAEFQRKNLGGIFVRRLF